MKIFRDGKEFELTTFELEAAYRERNMQYLVADAIGIAEEVLNESQINRLSEADYKAMAEKFEDKHDCNIADNDQWYYIIEHYARSKTLTLEQAQKIMAENNGNLDLSKSDIEKLPEGLTTVNGDLVLSETPIKELPEGLTTVNGDLRLSKTPIKELPEGLTVNGNLDICHTKIKTIPASVKVSGSIYYDESVTFEKPNITDP